MAVSVKEAEVLSSNRAFYAAFQKRDCDAMDSLWAQGVEVACVHPGWQPIRGRAEVMASWRAILGQPSAPKIECQGATASIYGETALVLCEEVLDDGRLVATNLFVREDGEWRICHHQAGPLVPLSSDSDDGIKVLEETGSEEDSIPPVNAARPSRRLLN